MQLKIWHKIMIGIAIPSFIALTGGLLTYGYIKDVKNKQAFVQIADDLKEHILEIRRNERNFLHYKNADYQLYLRNAILVFTTSIKNISPQTIEEIGEEDFLQLDKSIQTYSTLIDDLYENYQQETKVVEQVREEGRKLEDFIAKGKHTKELSMSFILNLRLLEKNYMLFRNRESFLKLNNALSELKDLTPFCYECASYIESIHNLFKTHEKSDSMINNLQTAGDNIEKVTGEIASREREQINSFLTLTQGLLLVGLALLCTLGPMFVYKTASYIATPIKRLADITKKISDGDITLRAPLKEHDETHSLAMSFNTMLDDLQWTQESLGKSLSLLHEKQAQLLESEKLASLGILTAGVAHELTNPLNNISMIAQTYTELYDKLSEEDRTGFMKKIEDETERIKEIVKNLLNFSKPKEANFKETDINPVIQNTLKLVQNMLNVSNINTKLNLVNGIPHVFIDEHQIQQVFVNLITNAVQAMPPKGELSIMTRYNKNNDSVEICFKDTGKGIPPEFLPHIFDPFFSTKGVEGTGLGLSVSYGIIKKHKGDIRVSSKVGVGTTFTIELPIYNKIKEERNEPT
jgi:signal transduction histidine kinase